MDRIKSTNLYNRFLTSSMFNVVMGFKHPIFFAKYLSYKVFAKKPYVLPLETSLNEIIEHKMSVARFGDGELRWMLGQNGQYAFQHGSLGLSQGLKRVLIDDSAVNCAICIPDVFNGLSNYMPQNKNAWIELIARDYHSWQPYLLKRNIYYDANITRFYIDRRDKFKTEHYFQLLKKIWNHRDVVIVEGTETRFGVGNDLLADADSVKRILGPATNAFDHYDEIMASVTENIDPSALILVALGPTATIMAFDLAKLGYQAIDIGHADLEYEWFKMKAIERVAIANRYVNEVAGGDQVISEKSDEYKNEIIAVVGEE